jgi:hypothetical protein
VVKENIMMNMRHLRAAVITVLALLPALLWQPAGAQDDTVTVYLHPVDGETGDALTAMCLKLGDASNTGCDENADGYIAFEGVHPGTYPVLQMRLIAGIVQLGATSITVADSPPSQYFTITFHELGTGGGTDTPVATEPGGATPIAIQTVAPPASGGASGGTVTALPNTGAGTSSLNGPLVLLLSMLAVLGIGGCVAVRRWNIR